MLAGSVLHLNRKYLDSRKYRLCLDDVKPKVPDNLLTKNEDHWRPLRLLLPFAHSVVGDELKTGAAYRQSYRLTELYTGVSTAELVHVQVPKLPDFVQDPDPRHLCYGCVSCRIPHKPQELCVAGLARAHGCAKGLFEQLEGRLRTRETCCGLGAFLSPHAAALSPCIPQTKAQGQIGCNDCPAQEGSRSAGMKRTSSGGRNQRG